MNETLEKYHLLPFRFERLNDSRELLVNEIGDYLILPSGTVQKIVNRDVKNLENATLIDLLSNNFISEDKIPKSWQILISRYRTRKSFLDKFTGLHIIVMTLRCNQNCTYCQVSHVTPKKKNYDITEEIIDKTIELIFNSPNKYLTIEFQGGEPLLVFDKIVYTVEKVKKHLKYKEKNIRFVICSNLTLITEDKLTFIKDNDVYLSTSLDGSSHIHNKNRLNSNYDSYQKTVNSIKLCKEVLGEDKISALMTATRYSLDYPEEIIDEYISLGFREVFLRGLNPYGFAVSNDNFLNYSPVEFFEFYKRAFLYIIKLNKEGFHFREVFTQFLITKIFTSFPIGFVDLQSPAGIITGVLLYNYDGDVYPSDEGRMLASSGDKFFKLGNVLSDNYKEIVLGEKSKELSECMVCESLAGCSDCAYQVYCGADPVRNYAVQNDMYGFRPTNDFCEKMKLIFNFLIELIDKDKSIEIIFNKWLNV